MDVMYDATSDSHVERSEKGTKVIKCYHQQTKQSSALPQGPLVWVFTFSCSVRESKSHLMFNAQRLLGTILATAMLCDHSKESFHREKEIGNKLSQ